MRLGAALREEFETFLEIWYLDSWAGVAMSKWQQEAKDSPFWAMITTDTLVKGHAG